MNIDRHNHEEFFILYWDNELNAQQKKLVEDFVKETPDLREEFQLFGETRFTPDENISFAKKELLLTKENAFINPANYHEQLLSYIDGELSTQENNVVEIFAANHPSIQLELALLQKTKLQPETDIFFPDKSILYRKEEKVHVIRMIWLRVAVAAILILITGLVTFRLITNSKKDGKPEIASAVKPAQKPVEKEIKNNSGINKNIVIIEKPLATSEKIRDKKEIILPKESTVAKNNISSILKKNKNNLPKEKRSVDQPLIAKIDLTKEGNKEVNIPEIRKSDNDAVVINDPEKANEIFINNNVTERNTPALNNQNTSGTGFANYKEDASSDKGGLKGFLRKATRVFEHRTKIQTTTDDNKLLVGVFAVSLK